MRPSMPVSCCSMTCVTLDSSVSADAPGYAARTLTEGGAMSGYCSTGSQMMPPTPPIMIRMEITQANTGRSMKVLETIDYPVVAGGGGMRPPDDGGTAGVRAGATSAGAS